ncbi:unnamed protein product [Mytilus edulis]|uniref:Ig-like domain-containing protein n=1 Tax=Mytilus edulis TaxID=6550 RepID=A0A8S3U7Z9_MYTED|nr:unnamed protein product [Mytilus edulis]
MKSAEKEYNLENAQQLLHQTILYANEISGPTGSALSNETPLHWVTSINPGSSTSASASDQPISPSSSLRESICNDPFSQDVPNVEIPLNQYFVNYGSTATIPCTVTANPTHTSVQWKIIVNRQEQNVDMQNDKYSGGTVNSPSLVIANAQKGR